MCSAARLSTPAPPEPLPHLYASANQLRYFSAVDFGTDFIGHSRLIELANKELFFGTMMAFQSLSTLSPTQGTEVALWESSILTTLQ